MASEYRARITWSAEQVRRGLPAITQIVDPAWFADDPLQAEGWSLICTFDSPVQEQGNPSAARVSFMVANAPHERLRPGVVLRLFERGTQRFATVEILS